MSMLEAVCTRCSEFFVPHGATPEDLIHGETETGKECGGIGIIQGRWILGQAHVTPFNLVKSVLAQEKHGKEHPHCEDPDCEFHHPEVREG